MLVIHDIIRFTLGVMLGGLWFTVIVLPLCYGVPMSIYWTAKGTLKARSILSYLGTFALWMIFLISVDQLLVKFFPGATQYLSSPGFYFGNWFGFLAFLVRALSKSGRKDLREDFWSGMARYQKANNHE